MKKLFMAALMSLALTTPVFADTIAVASWYQSGHRTANGEHFNPNGYTAAHRSLRFGVKIKVTNIKNNKSVIVRINDRGPFIKGRTLDLSRGAARKISLTGVARVRIKILE